jgi:hypothetical protein
MLLNRFKRALVVTLAFLGVLALTLAGPVEAQKLPSRIESEPQAVTKARVQEAFGKLPLYFIEN